MLTPRQKQDQQKFHAYLAIWDSLLSDNMKHRTLVRGALKRARQVQDEGGLEAILGDIEAFLIAHQEVRLTEKEFFIYQKLVHIYHHIQKLAHKEKHA